MNTLDVIRKLETWATDTVPELSSYDFPPEEITSALPLVMAEVQIGAAVDIDAAFPGFAQYQQTFLRTWVVDLTIFASPDPAWTASYALYEYVDALHAVITKGARLQEGVVMSQFYRANYNPPEAEYSDGTKMRQVTVTVTVAEMIGA